MQKFDQSRAKGLRSQPGETPPQPIRVGCSTSISFPLEVRACDGTSVGTAHNQDELHALNKERNDYNHSFNR